MSTVAEAIRRQLDPAERVLWSGQPRQGIFLRGSDAYLIPMSIFFCGFALIWEFAALTPTAPWFFPLFGIPFVAVGLYFLVGRFFFESAQRARTYYAVTDSRAVIVTGLFRETVKSLALRTLTDVTLSASRDGSGTITFGGAGSLDSRFNPFYGWPGMGQHLGPRFDTIAEAKRVYDLLRAAQRSDHGAGDGLYPAIDDRTLPARSILRSSLGAVFWPSTFQRNVMAVAFIPVLFLIGAGLSLYDRMFPPDPADVERRVLGKCTAALEREAGKPWKKEARDAATAWIYPAGYSDAITAHTDFAVTIDVVGGCAKRVTTQPS